MRRRPLSDASAPNGQLGRRGRLTGRLRCLYAPAAALRGLRARVRPRAPKPGVGGGAAPRALEGHPARLLFGPVGRVCPRAVGVRGELRRPPRGRRRERGGEGGRGADLAGGLGGGSGAEREHLEQPRPQPRQQSPFATDIDLIELPDRKKPGGRRRLVRLLWNHGFFVVGRLLALGFAIFLIYCTIADLGRYRWLSLLVAIPIEFTMLLLCEFLLKLPAWTRTLERLLTEKLLFYSHQIKQRNIGPHHMHTLPLSADDVASDGQAGDAERDVDDNENNASSSRSEDREDSKKLESEVGRSRLGPHSRASSQVSGARLPANEEEDAADDSSTSDVPDGSERRSRLGGKPRCGGASEASGRLHSVPEGSYVNGVDVLAGRSYGRRSSERPGRSRHRKASDESPAPSGSGEDDEERGRKAGGARRDGQAHLAPRQSTSLWRRMFGGASRQASSASPQPRSSDFCRVDSLASSVRTARGGAESLSAAGSDNGRLTLPPSLVHCETRPAASTQAHSDSERDAQRRWRAGERRALRGPGRAAHSPYDFAPPVCAGVPAGDAAYPLRCFQSDDLSSLWITYRSRPPVTRNQHRLSLPAPTGAFSSGVPVGGLFRAAPHSRSVRHARGSRAAAGWGSVGELGTLGSREAGGKTRSAARGNSWRQMRRFGGGARMRGLTSCVDLRTAAGSRGGRRAPSRGGASNKLDDGSAAGDDTLEEEDGCQSSRMADVFRLRSLSKNSRSGKAVEQGALQPKKTRGPLYLSTDVGNRGAAGSRSHEAPRDSGADGVAGGEDDADDAGNAGDGGLRRRGATLSWLGGGTAYRCFDEPERSFIFRRPLGRGYSLGGFESRTRFLGGGSGPRHGGDWRYGFRFLMLDEDDGLVDEPTMYEVEDLEPPESDLDDDSYEKKGRDLARTRRQQLASWCRCCRDVFVLMCRCGLVVFESIAVPALASAAFLLAVLLRTMAWCAVWVWASTHMEREPQSKDLFAWQLRNLPQAYYFVESTFLWMVTFDYCAGLFTAPRKLPYILSPYSIVDLLTMPMTSFLVNCFVQEHHFGSSPETHWNDGAYGDPDNLYDPRTKHDQFPWLLLFGWLRFLRLVKTEHVLSRCFPHLSIVKLRIVSIVVSWLMIVLTFAGGMFVLEAPEPDINYTNVYDFCFYAIVTVMTVGYGDFVPRSAAGRTLAIVTIISTFAFLPGEVQRLMEALREPRTIVGSPPAPGDDYLCIVGPIQPLQLSVICREIARAFPGSVRSILVVTPLPVSSYDSTCFFSLSVCIRGGVKGEPLPSNIRSYCSNARAVFIFSNTRAYQVSAAAGGLSEGAAAARADLSWTEGVETREQEEDQKTLLRFMGVRTVCFPVRPINVQLIHDHRKALVKEMGAYCTLCINEVKMKLLGKSCADCPGFVSLIANWFTFWRASEESTGIARAASRARLAAASSLGPRRKTDFQHYADGAVYNIYRMEFPESMWGLHYKLLTRLLYTHYEVFLIGIIAITKEIWINPFRYIVGEELIHGYTTWPFAGIVLAPSLETVVKLSTLRDLPVKVPRAPCFSSGVGGARTTHPCYSFPASGAEKAGGAEDGRGGGLRKRGWSAKAPRAADDKAAKGSACHVGLHGYLASEADLRGGESPVASCGDGVAGASRISSPQRPCPGVSPGGECYPSPSSKASHAGAGLAAQGSSLSAIQGHPPPPSVFSASLGPPASCFASAYAGPGSVGGPARFSFSPLAAAAAAVPGVAGATAFREGLPPSASPHQSAACAVPLCSFHRGHVASGGTPVFAAAAAAPLGAAGCASPLPALPGAAATAATAAQHVAGGAGPVEPGGAGRGEWRPGSAFCVMCQRDSAPSPFESIPFGDLSDAGPSAAFSYVFDLHGNRRGALGGITQTQSVAEARRCIFANPMNPLILACGWPRGLRIFLQALLANGAYNVMILSPCCPATVGPTDFAAYTTCCAHVRGSALSTTDLLRAGALQAKNCAVFSTLHVTWKGDLSAERLDTQALLVRKTIQALFRACPAMRIQSQGLPPPVPAAAEPYAPGDTPSEQDDFDRENGSGGYGDRAAPGSLGGAQTTQGASAGSADKGAARAGGKVMMFSSLHSSAEGDSGAPAPPVGSAAGARDVRAENPAGPLLQAAPRHGAGAWREEACDSDDSDEDRGSCGDFSVDVRPLEGPPPRVANGLADLGAFTNGLRRCDEASARLSARSHAPRRLSGSTPPMLSSADSDSPPDDSPVDCQQARVSRQSAECLAQSDLASWPSSAGLSLRACSLPPRRLLGPLSEASTPPLSPWVPLSPAPRKTEAPDPRFFASEACHSTPPPPPVTAPTPATSSAFSPANASASPVVQPVGRPEASPVAGLQLPSPGGASSSAGLSPAGGPADPTTPLAAEKTREQRQHQSAVQHELEQLLEEQHFQSQLRQQPTLASQAGGSRHASATSYAHLARSGSLSAGSANPLALDPETVSSLGIRLPVAGAAAPAGTSPQGGAVPRGVLAVAGPGGLPVPPGGAQASPQSSATGPALQTLGSFPTSSNPVALSPVSHSASLAGACAAGLRIGSAVAGVEEAGASPGVASAMGSGVWGTPAVPGAPVPGVGSPGDLEGHRAAFRLASDPARGPVPQLGSSAAPGGAAPAGYLAGAGESCLRGSEFEENSHAAARFWRPAGPAGAGAGAAVAVAVAAPERERDAGKDYAATFPPSCLAAAAVGLEGGSDMSSHGVPDEGPSFLQSAAARTNVGGAGGERPDGLWRVPEAIDLQALMDEKARKEPGIFLDLKEASFLEYCDNSMLMNESLVWERIGPYRQTWAAEQRQMTAAYLGSLLFASGHACVEDMFYGLMAHSLPVSKYAVDASVIDYLVENRKEPLSAKTRLKRRLMCPPSVSVTSPAPAVSPLGLEPVPPMFVGVPFKRLFEHFIKLEKKIAIAIYRQYRVTTDYAGNRRPKKLVLCCPSQQLRLNAFDMVYVLRPCSTDELRAPRGFL
ncbi:ion channel protein [Besnoitia besnoiti]|uniref:Ion channel protein n=1 Tax=Besnoitia besnoiti TaxID=94643 RepID=A0A2A9MMP5_BESBE|nr:ion channel protein [Besnoitia besnoiti]PFH37396.1 ion channel protein [Besnoitia besnoiti]